jgi:hypothetical protein
LAVAGQAAGLLRLAAFGQGLVEGTGGMAVEGFTCIDRNGDGLSLALLLPLVFMVL